MEYTVAVIIPLYKNILSDLEIISMRQCFKILSKHPIIAVKPQALSLDNYTYPFNDVISFHDSYFQDIKGYNQLMMSAAFYEKFLAYQYILIYQPDAFVFHDSLLYWCSQNYDYIGAPWLKGRDYSLWTKTLSRKIKKYYYIKKNIRSEDPNHPHSMQLEDSVGNGGFSLRKTQKFYDICLSHQDAIALFNSQSPDNFSGEDVFWGIEVNRKKKHLNIPNYREAAHFAIEHQVHYALQLTGDQLPFGCHAWDINYEFWRPIFKRVDVII